MEDKMKIQSLNSWKTSEWACPSIFSIESFKDYLFVGDGNFLALYDSSDIELKPKYCPIFPSGISITGMFFMERDHEVILMITGSDSFRSASFSKDLNGSLETDCCGLSSIGRTVDRILCGLWLTDGEPLMAMANNTFHLYTSKQREENNEFSYEKTNIYCGIPCVLYSAEVIGKTLKAVRAFVATVFSQIDIYSLEYNDKTTMGIQIAHLLFSITGHNGVAFSLKYFENEKILLSTSDDRKVIVWKTELGSGITCISQEEELIGHTARVFQAVLCGKDVFSVGEDSCVINWQWRESGGRVSRVLPGHSGAPVRGCTFNEKDSTVYTCADDGSICRWKLDTKFQDHVECQLDSVWNESRIDDSVSANLNDFPRRICLVDEQLVVATTNSGKVCLISDVAKSVFEDPSMRKYQSMSVSKLYKTCAIGTLSGSVRLMSLVGYPEVNLNEVNQFMIPGGGKVMHIFWTNEYLVVTSQKNLFFYFLGTSGAPKFPNTTSRPQCLPLSVSPRGIYGIQKRSQVSAVHGFSGYMAVGYDNGDLELIDLDCMRRIQFSERHNFYGVGGIIYFKNCIVTGGRDGRLRFFDPTPLISEENQKNEEGVILETRNVDVPFNWIAGIFLYQDQMLILGFDFTDVIIYCPDRDQVIVRTSCGGSHRSWDFHCSENGRCGFVYLKDQAAHKVMIELDSFLGRCVKAGTQRKLINCVATISESYGAELPCYFASGSEDSTIEIFSLKLNKSALENDIDSVESADSIIYTKVETLRVHTSGVRVIASEWCSEKRGVLATGGGRSELFFIPFSLSDTGTELSPCGVPKRIRFGADMDFRVMGISLIVVDVPWSNSPLLHRRCSKVGKVLFAFVACSDGVVRFVREDGRHRSLSFRNYPRWKTHSIQVVDLVFREGHTKSHCLLYAGTSNGLIIGWTVELSDHEHLLSDDELKKPFVAALTINTDHATVSALRITPKWPNQVELLVGFDSGCITMCSELKSYIIRLRDNSKNSPIAVMAKCTGSVPKFAFDVDEKDESGASIVYSASNHMIQRHVLDKEVNEMGILEEASTGIRDCQGMLRVKFGNEGYRFGAMVYYIMCYGTGIRVVPV